VQNQSSVNRLPAPAAKGKINYELCIVATALLLTALIPGLSKYRGDDAGSTSSTNEIFWCLMYIATAIRLFTLRATVLPLFKRSATLWAFVFLMFASVLWSVDPGTTFTNAVELIGTTIIGFYIVSRFTLPQFMGILALTFVAIALLSFAFIYGAPAHGRENWGGGPWEGLYQDKNNLGAATTLAIISQMLFLGHSRGRTRGFVIAGLVLLFVLLVGSNSATAFGDGFVVVAVSLGVLAAKSPKFGVLARVLMVAVAAIVLVGVVGFNLTPDSIFSMLGRQSNLTGRTDFWPYLQQGIADRPWFGYGYNAFFRSGLAMDYLGDYLIDSGGWMPYHAHNSFLQILLDAGYVGLASLALVLVDGLWKGVRYCIREPGRFAPWPLAIILYLFLGSFTETYFGNFNTVEWILFVAAFLYPMRGIAFAPKPKPARLAFTKDSPLGQVPGRQVFRDAEMPSRR
jgi:exopolysaccharide production protein ExoQ